MESIFWYLLPYSVNPTFVMDVSGVMDKWHEAASCYASQLDNIPNYYDRLIRHKIIAGAHIGVAHGESFLCDIPLNATGADILEFSPTPDYKDP